MATTIYKFQSDLKGLQQLNAGLKEAQANLANLKKGTKEYAAVSKNVGGMTQSLKNNTSALTKTRTAANQLNKSGRGLMTTFKGASIAIISAFAFRAIMAGMRGLVTIFAKFEAQMAAVKAISGATDAEFENLVKSAKDLGETTVFTAAEVAKLQEELSRLGFEAPQIIAMQASILNLAAATGETLAKAAEVAGAQINAFGLEAEQATRVTDVMGFAFANSALNLERFTQSMKFVAPVAKTAGFTIEETSSMLMVLADNGIHGSIAGNALKNVFLRLGDANSKLNQSIGRTVQGLPQLINEMHKMNDATFGLTEATELLDKRSAPAFLTLLRNIEELEIASDQINHVEGEITRMAAIRLDTLEGDFTLLKSATEGLGLAIGESLNFEFRKLIYVFTEWIRSIASSDKAIQNIKSAIFMLVTSIKFLLLRMAALKALTLSSNLSFKALKAGMLKMVAAFRVFGVSVRGASTALKGFRMALASTGVGALIVGLGMLVGYFSSLGDSAEESAFKIDRLFDSFNKELAVITSLGVYTKERHDKLRELSATYKELLGNIDVEIMSTKDLIKLQTILNGLKGEQTALGTLKDELKVLEEQHAQLIANAVIEKQRLEATGESGTETVRQTYTVTKGSSVTGTYTDTKSKLVEIEVDNARAIELEQEKIDGLKKTMDEELNNKKAVIDEMQKLLQTEFENQAEANDIAITSANEYRMELRDTNLNDLEDFRTMSHSKQTLIKEEAETRLEEFIKIQELLEMQTALDADSSTLSVEEAQKRQATITRILDGTSKEAKETFEEVKNKQGQINIMISEYSKYVSNLSKVLDNSGKSYRRSSLSGFRLQKTKDRLKELLKIQISQINDQFKHDMAANQASFDAKVEKYKKEGDLMKTNQRSIQKIIDKNVNKSARKRHKQWVADIKANKNNYDVLKNMDIEEWDKLMDIKQNNNDDYLKILDAMMDEEQEKIVTNNKILIELEKEFANEKWKIEAENRARIEEFERERARQITNLNETDLINLFDNQKKRKKLLEDDHAAAYRADFEMWMLGEMTEIEFQNRKRARAEEMKALEKKDREEQLEAFQEMYSAMADVIMAVSGRIAQTNMDNIQKEHEQRTEDLNNQFERDLELAEQHGGDTEAMQRTHDDKMEALEKIKEDKIRQIKKRQFILDKANSVAMTIINGAQAIAKVTAETGIGAIVAAPVTAGLIAAQIATIMAQKFTGAKGGIIPGGDDKFADGGMVVGPSHANGGVKFAVGGRVAELEGGEAVINKRSTAMFRGQLSAMNQAGGGVKFQTGGITPGTRAALDGAKGNWSAGDIAELISSSINAQQVYVSESEITSTQSNVGVTESLSTLF